MNAAKGWKAVFAGGVFFACFAAPLHAAAVSSLNYSHVSSNTLAVQWTNQTGNSYLVALSSVAGFAVKTASNIGPADQNTTFYTGLQANTSYTYLIKISTDSDSSYVAASTYTWAISPGVTGFKIFATSATFTLNAGLNDLSSTLSMRVSTGAGADFSVALSSSGAVGGAQSTWILTGLTSGATYAFQTQALNFSGLPSTVTIITASTFTATAPTAPTTFALTALGATSATFGWTDSSANEDGFQILNSTNGLYGQAAANATSLSASGLTPNTLIAAKIVSFNVAGPSTSGAVISSYTLANAPASLTVYKADRNSVTLLWSSNSNSTSTLYEISQSSDDFAFAAGISTPVAFSQSLASTSNTISGLTSGGTYYFRVRARNGDGVITAFSASAGTTTTVGDTYVSTGSSIVLGNITVKADAGVTILVTSLSDGTTLQVLTATQTANVSYSNGMLLSLPPGQSQAIVTTESIQFTSSQTVPLSNSGVTMALTSGTFTLTSSAQQVTVSVSSNSSQDFQLTLPSTVTKTVSLSLNTISGEIKAVLEANTFSQDVRLRMKLPSSLPAAALGFAPSAAPSTMSGTGVGLELSLDKALQPLKVVNLSMTYRAQDIGSADPRTLAIARYETSASKWLTLGGATNAATRVVTGRTNHFSTFQVMSVTPATDINQARAYPNPLRPYLGHLEMTITDVTANASVRIYTYSGELVRSFTADGTGTVRWDGKNGSGEAVASGVYLVLLEGVSGSRKVIAVSVER